MSGTDRVTWTLSRVHFSIAVSRSAHLSSVVLNAKVQLHALGPPKVLAAEISFKLICGLSCLKVTT